MTELDVASAVLSQESRPLARWSSIDRISALIVAMALAAGIGLRVVDLGNVPPGFDQDEACSAYDAYSILKTGRDHHGNFLPLYLRAFNDYRMAMFEYSMIPLIGAFGLSPRVARLGAALWGSADLCAVSIMGGVMLGWPGAAIASVLGAFSPWQLPLSRFCHQAISASATVSLAMMCFLLWLTRRRGRWLILSAALLGLSLYAYAITKAFVPPMLLLLGTLYWRELRSARTAAFAALGIVAALAAPHAIMLWRNAAQMQARFSDLSILSRPGSWPGRLENLAAGLASYFTPAYLFVTGDRGDHWTLLHPPGFGQLLPEQAPLIALAGVALLSTRHRRLVILLVGWLVIATIPAALTVPLGAVLPLSNRYHGLPTPGIMFTPADTQRSVPVTPSLLLAHPNLRHDVLAITPWILLSALGFAVLLEATARAPRLRIALAAAIVIAATLDGLRFARSYFRDYPVLAAPYFQYGMAQVVGEVARRDSPVVIANSINQPYMYVLFFEPYPPALFQRGPVEQRAGLFGAVTHFDRYWFLSPLYAYSRLGHGTFVFRGDQPTPAPPALSIRYPDGTIAYNILEK